MRIIYRLMQGVSEVNESNNLLSEEFDMKDLGSTKKILGHSL